MFSISRITVEYDATLRKIIELQAVSGMTVDELIEKFVNGYVLVSPFAAGEIKDKLDLYTTNYTKLETLYD